MRILRPRKQFTTALAFNPAGDKLAVGGKVRVGDGRNPGRIDVWNLLRNDLLVTLPTLPGHVVKLGISADTALVAIVPNRVLFFSGNNLRDLQIVREWNDAEYRALTISPDASRLIILSARSIQLIELGPPFNEVWNRPASVNNLSMSGKVAFSPNGRIIAVPQGRAVELRDFATGEVLSCLENPVPPEQFLGFNLCWSTDGRWIAEASQDWGNVWNVISGRHVFHLNSVHSESMIASMFHPSTGWLGVATEFRLRIFEPESWEEKSAHACPCAPISAAASDADGNIAVGGDNGVVLWNVSW
jgi:WD40 repeat protein